MKSIVVPGLLAMACAVSPACADVYQCKAGGQTVYQDVPCPNARVLDNLDRQAPSSQTQAQAKEQAARERDLLARMSEARAANEAREARAAKSRKQAARPKAASPPAASSSRQPDKYYDRPDRYYGRPDRYDNRAANNARPLRSR